MKRSARIVAVASVAWLGVAAWAIATDSRAGEMAALVAGMVLLAAVWLLLRATDSERRRWQHTLDAMQAGIVLYDADDRLVLTNAEFRSLYQLEDSLATRGMPFEELLRTRVLRGLVPEAIGREESWIAERLAQHRSGEGRSFLREMADSRWRRITEQRLPDGSRLGFSIDITELVENQRALDAARHEAERAHQLMHDAIEAMPAAVEIYDRSDRLVLFNQRMLQLYPHMAGQHPARRDLRRAGAQRRGPWQGARRAGPRGAVAGRTPASAVASRARRACSRRPAAPGTDLRNADAARRPGHRAPGRHRNRAAARGAARRPRPRGQ